MKKKIWWTHHFNFFLSHYTCIMNIKSNKNNIISKKVYHLLALISAATDVFEWGGFVRSKQGWCAAITASARYPSSIVASVHGHEQGLWWGAYLGSHNVSWALYNLPARGNGHNGPTSHQASQELHPGLVLGLQLEDTLFPWEWLWWPEWGTWAEHMEHLEGWAMILGITFGVEPLDQGEEQGDE